MRQLSTNSFLKVYELSEEDRLQVEAKMGNQVGELPILDDARKAFYNRNQNSIKKL